MFKHLRRVGASIGLLLLSATLPAAASEATFSGYVVHVSLNNIKVENSAGQSLGFELVPHFDQVFQFDGKTTYQMKRIHTGTFVKVYYDQHLLGIRHADKIILIHANGRRTKIGG